jgi:hypothetical protein
MDLVGMELMGSVFQVIGVVVVLRWALRFYEKALRFYEKTMKQLGGGKD